MTCGALDIYSAGPKVSKKYKKRPKKNTGIKSNEMKKKSTQKVNSLKKQ